MIAPEIEKLWENILKLSRVQYELREELKNLAGVTKTLVAGDQEFTKALTEFMEGQKEADELMNTTVSALVDKVEELEKEVKDLRDYLSSTKIEGKAYRWGAGRGLTK